MCGTKCVGLGRRAGVYIERGSGGSGSRKRRASRVVRGRLKAEGSIGKCRGARARTSNMDSMSVTLDVLKLSGWLKADAEVNMKPMSVTQDVSKLSGWLKADAKSNIQRMFLTLDVSKLSGWLKADADSNM